MVETENEKRSGRPELYILLLMGVKPDVLIKKGYSKATVYSYNRKIPALKKRINEMIE